MDMGGRRQIFYRLGPSSSSEKGSRRCKPLKVCIHWRKGKCSRYPCPFLHSEFPTAAGNGKWPSELRRSGDYNFKVEKLCKLWVQGNCKLGENCMFLHMLSTGTPVENMDYVNTIDQELQGGGDRMKGIVEVTSLENEKDDDERDNIEHDKMGDDENDGEDEDGKGQVQRKKKRKISKAHVDFDDVTLKNGTEIFECNHFQKLLSKTASGTTTHPLNHFPNSKIDMNPLSEGKYDHVKQREAIAHWILMNGQPFNVVESCGFSSMFQVNLPKFEKISCTMAKNDVISVYDTEKKTLQLMLKWVNKISLTADIWKSVVQNISYMCVTGHFVDSQWQLQKRLLSFIPLPLPHTGVDVSDGLMKCTKDWGIEHKVFTISVGNAMNNYGAIQIAKETFSRSRKLPLDGMLFHVQCSAHILNRVVQDGLACIKFIVDDMNASVRFINQSESRLRMFSDIVHHLGIPVPKLIIDCSTRWNSTYEMLVEAIKVKDAFSIFAQRETLYTCPNPEEWDRVQDVIDILRVFHEATHVISGTHYPTSNVFLAVIWRVKHMLNENENHRDEFIRGMVKNMKEKFDRYWESCNLLMAIGAILDPRFKMRLVDFAFSKIYNEVEARTNVMKVRNALYDLYLEYVENDTMKSPNDSSLESDMGPPMSSKSEGKMVPSGLLMFDEYLNTVEVDGPVKSELDIYLEEGVFRCQDGDVTSEFDALAWWKSHELKFNVLSKLARDILAIPLGTVAITRVLIPYCAGLSPDIAQVLICGGDWVRQLHGMKKSSVEEEKGVDVCIESLKMGRFSS